MATELPTPCELRCTGCAMILAQIIGIIAGFFSIMDYDVYDVKSEEEVVEMHNIVSSDEHRLNIEIACAFIWMCFPLLLIALYGIKKLGYAVYANTPAEMLTYIAEKAFIFEIGIVCIVHPALLLVSVSYEWSFYESTASDTTATGYWIQLYVIIFDLELIDCMAVADATFMVAYFLTSFYYIYVSTHDQTSKFAKSQQGTSKRLLNVSQCVHICCISSLLIVFLIIIFEFAESGFFSPTGHARSLIGFVILSKIFIGYRFIMIANKKYYDKIYDAFNNRNDRNDAILNEQPNNYQMEQIDTNQNVIAQ